MIFHRKGKKAAASEGQSNSTPINKVSNLKDAPTPIFNVPLPIALKNNPSIDGIPVPALVRICIDYVTDNGLTTEGIYRISAPKNVVDEQERAVNFGEIINFTCVHEAANLLKRFLRGLPEHILTDNYRREVEKIALQCGCNSTGPCRCEVAQQLADFLSTKLPAANHYLLAYVFLHAQQIILNADTNKMNLMALGTLLQQIFNLSSREVRIFLLNASSLLLKEGDDPITELFAGIPFERYNQPKETGKNNYAISASDSVLTNELSRQEALLADIDEQLKHSQDKNSTEEKEAQKQKIKQQISELKQRLSNQAYPSSSNASPQINHKLSLGPLPPVFLEKHLLSTHSSLKEDIEDEKKKIGKLLTNIRNIQNELTPEVRASLEPMPSTNNVTEVSVQEEADKLSTNKTRLLDDIMYYRDLNAQLRSRYEQCVLLSNQAKRNKELSVVASTSSSKLETDNSLLVTRF